MIRWDSFMMTVSDTTPTREGYSFTGWNTAADGSVLITRLIRRTRCRLGTDTLYAQWDPNTVTLAYGTEWWFGAPNDQRVIRSVMACRMTPTREGYSFTGGTPLLMGLVLIAPSWRTHCRFVRTLAQGIPIRSRAYGAKVQGLE